MPPELAERPAGQGQKRSRLEKFQAVLEQRQRKLDEARTELVDLAGKEQQAIAEALRKDPDKSAFARGEPGYEIRKKYRELEVTIAGLEKELLALQGETDAAAAEAAAAGLVAATKRAASLNRREAERVKRAGERLAELLEEWNAIAEVLGERSELIGQVVLAKLVDRAELFYAAEVAAFHEAASFPIEPVPTTFAAFVELLLEVAVERSPDEDPDDRREMNRQRVAAGLAPEPTPAGPSELARHLPDLRGRASVAEVSAGHAAIRRPPEEAGSPWLGSEF